MLLLIIFLTISTTAWLFSSTLSRYLSLKRPGDRRIVKYPPSPPKVPFIGNLHQLGSFPHRSIRALAVQGEDGLDEFLKEFFLLLGAFHIGDYIPSLTWIGRLNGLDARLKRHARQWNVFLDKVIAEHVEKKKKEVDAATAAGRKDFLDILLEIEKGGSVGVPFTKDHIKALLLNNFAAGADTIYTAINWILAELVRHPKEMKKVQEEIRGTVAGKSRSVTITEDDLREMPYLKCVIKEGLRLHPPFPLLLPRNCMHDTEVMGYHVPGNSRVIVNAWAIGRDPKAWDNPEEFMPERFVNMNSTEDYFKGHDFGFIPFGSGRRACPGVSFAVAAVELVTAAVLHAFDWELPGGASAENLDMSEVLGATTRKKVPLILLATPYPPNN